MTGRWHKGDENGKTQYEYATLKAVDENGNEVQANIEVTDIKWSAELKESSGSGFRAEFNRVIVGRWHKGDENGKTKYATAIVKADGIIVETVDDITSSSFKESGGTWFVTDAERVIVGRVHKGDENGKTFYISAKLLIDESLKEPAPKGTMIVPYKRMESEAFKESNSSFICPINTIITGRYHSGDENGTTIYQYASLKAINSKGEMIMGTITVEDIRWETVLYESLGSGFDAGVNRVIVGRKHYGDENEPTQYATGIVRFNGYPTYISEYTVSEIQKEPSGWFECPENNVITARHHYGDENGYTYYGLGIILCDEPLKKVDLPFDVMVVLSKGEQCCPMSAIDFVVLSRFRRHIENGSDQGYDKNTNSFVIGNSNSLNYYNIPLSVINNFYSKIPHKRLFNFRPRALMSVPNEWYFLQPFTHLYGDSNPSGKVPAYVNILEYVKENGQKVKYVDFWLFFGYNEVEISAHEGDWEHLMVEVIDDRINGCWLSSHISFGYHPNSLVYRSSSKLKIETINGRQQLTVYCAFGTHALYADIGKYPIFDIAGIQLGFDHTSDGYKWKITDNMALLSEEPWKLFAGAWGEVGEMASSTGPLGPWYKRFDFWYESNIKLSNLITSAEIIIVPDKYYISDEHKESSGFMFEAPQGMALVGRRHFGDENGMTTCMYASLKAINSSGVTQPGTIVIVDSKWSDWYKESNATYQAPSGYIIIGRQHSKDENGKTRYKIGKVTFNGRSTSTQNANSLFEYQIYAESAGVFFQTEPYFLYIGRTHYDDENGLTYNIQGIVKVV